MPAGNIVTLTVNPAVDVSAAVAHIVPFHKLRCISPRRDAGGGGINVARVARRFGGDPVALYLAGGPIGALLERLVQAEDVSHVALPIRGDTREDFTVDETATGAQYRFVLPGPNVSSDECEACLEAVAARLSEGTYLVASGSLPAGVPDDFYGRVGRIAADAGAKFVLDSSGPALRAALGSNVYMIKPSLNELGELIGSAPSDRDAQIAASRRLVAEKRTAFVALSLGEQGALLVGQDLVLSASAPKIKPVSTVGAGDCFLGAMVWAMAHGHDAAEALRFAVAAGSAALLSPGTGLSHVDDVTALLSQVRVEKM